MSDALSDLESRWRAAGLTVRLNPSVYGDGLLVYESVDGPQGLKILHDAVFIFTESGRWGAWWPARDHGCRRGVFRKSMVNRTSLSRTTWFLRKAAASSLEHCLVCRFDRSVVACWFATPRTPPLWQRDFFLVNYFCVATLVGFGEKRCRKNLPLCDLPEFP